MWLQNIVGLAFCLLAFSYLRQITTWTLASFRNGIVVYKSVTPFSARFPQESVNREIGIKNIIFRFISPTTGLFKAHPPMSFFKDRIRNYFPSLLGEIELDDNGVAQITLRIPLSIILLSSSVFIAVAVWNVEEILTTSSSFLELAKCNFLVVLLSALFFFDLAREKEHLYEGFTLLKERIDSGALD